MPAPTLRDLPPPPPGRAGWPWTAETPPQPPPAGPLPRITVVTPSYNQADYLEATLRSVLLQGYPDLEYFVMDGGSKDASPEIVRRYAPWLAGWVSQRDGGQSSAINAGFAKATGDVVAWLNSDDRYLPGTLHAVARQVAARRDAVAWVGGCRSVDPAGRTVDHLEPRGLELPALADWLREGRFAQPACFFAGDALRRAGPLDEQLQLTFDVDLFIRLAKLGPYAGTRETWAEETIHPAAKTSAQPGRSLAELHLVQIRNGFEQLALKRLTDELEEFMLLKRGTLADRAWYVLHAARVALASRLRR